MLPARSALPCRHNTSTGQPQWLNALRLPLVSPQRTHHHPARPNALPPPLATRRPHLAQSRPHCVASPRSIKQSNPQPRTPPLAPQNQARLAFVLRVPPLPSFNSSALSSPGGQGGSKEENPICPPAFASSPGKPGKLRSLTAAPIGSNANRFGAGRFAPCSLGAERALASQGRPTPPAQAATLDSGHARSCGKQRFHVPTPPIAC
jgi:hypothetical protein